MPLVTSPTAGQQAVVGIAVCGNGYFGTESRKLATIRRRNVTHGQMTTQLHVELEHYPRGTPASPQNLFRSVYQMARMNSMGKKAELPNSASAVREFALGSVREWFPGFELTEI